MRRRAWRLPAIAGVFMVAVLPPLCGEPTLLVGSPTVSSAETSLTDVRQAMVWPGVLRDGFLLAGVSKSLAKRITSAQDTRESAFTIAIDGGQPEPLAVSAARLRDYQNVYYRVLGRAGAWRLEERGFSPTGADDESKLIRRGLGVLKDRRVYFLPGRQHLLIPAKVSVVLSAGGERWDSRVQIAAGFEPITHRAVLLVAGQATRLVLGEALSTASARVGISVALTVGEDVVAEGLVAIAKGTPVEARVVEVTPPDAVGNPGTLVLELGVAKAVDGSDVPLAGPQGRLLAFEGRPGAFCFVRARHLELPSGTIVSARAKSTVAILAPVPEAPGAVDAVPRMGEVTQAP